MLLLVAATAATPVSCSLFDVRSSGPGAPAGSTDQARNRIWHVADSGGFGGPAYDGTTTYFLGKHHNVVAIDGLSGVIRWTASTQGSGAQSYGHSGCVMAPHVVVCGDDDLIGFQSASGSMLWRYHATVGYSPGYFAPVAVGSMVFAGSPSGTLYGIDAGTGTSHWATRPFPSDSENISFFDPSADSDIVVSAFTKFLVTKPSVGGVVALDAATGQVRWITYLPQVDSTVATTAGSTAIWQNVVLTSSNTAGTIYALDRVTGAISWTLPGVGTRPASRGSTAVTQDQRVLTVVGNTLFAASLSDWLVAYSLQDRSELWRTESAEGSASLAPIAGNASSIYVTLVGGQLVAFSSTGASVRWMASGDPDSFFGTVAVGADRIFAGRVDGFYALPK